MTSTRTLDLGPVSLVIDEAGVGGSPLLLVHGFTGARNDFRDAIDPLAELGWHVVAPDQRGHGGSTHLGDEAAYSFDIFAADLLALADALGWDDFVLLGHSMGGMVAQSLVLTAPKRVRALVLMDTSCRNLDVPAELVELGTKIAWDDGLERLVAVQRDIEDPLETPAHRRTCDERPGYEEQNDANTIAADPMMYAAMAVAITAPYDRLAHLSVITCPTLVLVGEQDTPFLEPSLDMARTIPGAQLRVIADAGHAPQFESADAWWDALKPFLATLA